jgi:hypothetical protein
MDDLLTDWIYWTTYRLAYWIADQLALLDHWLTGITSPTEFN